MEIRSFCKVGIVRVARKSTAGFIEDDRSLRIMPVAVILLLCVLISNSMSAWSLNRIMQALVACSSANKKVHIVLALVLH